MNTPIKREDIRKGDRIRRSVVSEYTATQHGTPLLRDEAYQYELIERPVQLPTEPGFYMTPASPPDVFQLLETGAWFEGQTPISNERVRHDGGNSLTLLRPVAEVAAEVLAEVRDRYFDKGEGLVPALDATAAKWATK